MGHSKKYTAKYFSKTVEIAKKFKPKQVTTMQFFQRKEFAFLAGMKEVLEFLNNNTDVSKYKIRYLPDKSLINSRQVVLELEGLYQYFGLYEGVIDGILSRATSLATNAYNVVKAAKGKSLIFMGDRSDHYLNQSRDGYAIALGGISTQVTDEQIAFHDGKAIGTVPHALIQMFSGDLVAALEAYQATFPNQKLTALVDYNNDVIGDSLKAWKAFGSDLFAVRVDTAEDVSDVMFKGEKQFGVTPELVNNLRTALNLSGAKDVKIIISSGLTAQKIELFEKAKAPVDFYGVGSDLLVINHTFSADAVALDGRAEAKVGRFKQEAPNLRLY